MIYKFNTKAAHETSEIGGKAKSLIQMTQAGFNVPDGCVLSSDFFKSWIDAIKKTQEWIKLTSQVTKLNCDAVKAVAEKAVFSVRQDDELLKAIRKLNGVIFAVRSSSPQEDMRGISFAGMYETYLGVKKEKLKDAISKAFTSMFDYRVIHYKEQNGIDFKVADMAIIIQEQIDSDVSGVGFSMNPMNNDYDETVINSSYGLGEAIVSGGVTPDNYIIDKVKNIISEKTKGKHEISIRLADDGGVFEEKAVKINYSLRDQQVIEISEQIKEIEDFYGFPVDIEWAIKDEILFILQGRPITAYVPLEPHMMTQPGENRMLYMDANLVDGLTSNVPITPLTIDWYYGAFMLFVGPIFGGLKFNGHLPPKDGMVFNGSGRVYLNLSQFLHLTKLEKLLATGKEVDKQIGQIAKSIDSNIYKMEKPLSYLKLGFILRKSPRLIWNARKLISKMIRAYFNPFKFYHDDLLPNVDRAINRLKSDAYNDIPLSQITDVIEEDLDNVLFYYCFSAIVPLMISMGKIPKLVKDGTIEMDELADAVFLGTDDNESIELGIAMYHMTNMLEKSDFDDLDGLARLIESRDLSDDFMKEWDQFIEMYKFRGPNELELSNSRYGDNYKLALQQMSYMVGSDYNPEESKKRNVVKRERAYEKICTILSGRKLKQFKTNYDIATTYSTMRDTPKYIWLLENGIVRKRALFEGQGLVDENYLEAKEDIFYLYFKEIEKAQRGEVVDLRAIVEERKAIYSDLNNIDSYPIFIDSRGRILVAKAEKPTDGSFVGHGISRGVKTGRIKVMKSPTEKPIEKGDVLVTYTTDPGWTPLFVNVEAVILQVGGMLQHGGVVAREYGKPCVAGIANVYDTFRDGQLVEVDGTNGVVKILDEQ